MFFAFAFSGNAHAQDVDPYSSEFGSCIDFPVLKAFYTKSESPLETIRFFDMRRVPTYLDDLTYYHSIKEVTDLNLKLLGSGIKSKETGESVSFACVGAGFKCNCVRAVYRNPETKKTFAFGETYMLYDIYKKPDTKITNKLLRNFFKNQLSVGCGLNCYGNDGLRYLVNTARNFKDDDGWNWSTNPDKVSDKRFLSTMGSLDKYILMPGKVIHQWIEADYMTLWNLRLPDKDKYLLNLHMIRLTPNESDEYIQTL